MLTLSKEKDRTTNNIWHSPSSKSNGIYTVEPATHNTNEHDAGSLSSSPLSSPDSKNVPSELQQHLSMTDTNLNISSRQSSPLSELTNLNDDDQLQDQQEQQPEQTNNQQSAATLSDSSSSNLNSNAAAGQVSNSSGRTDESRDAEVKSDLPVEQPANGEPAGDSTNATATLSVTSRQQQPHQPQQHTHTSNSKSLSSSSQQQQQQHVNGMGVPSPLSTHDYSSSALTPAASATYSSAQTPAQPRSNELNSSKPSSNIPDEKATVVFLLNVELLKICMEFQSRQLLQSPEFNSYATRLQSNLTWLAAVADQPRQSNVSLPVMTPPVPLPWHPPHTINSFYQRLPSLFAKEIARRQAASTLTTNPNSVPGRGSVPPSAAGVQSPLSTGAGSLHPGSIPVSQPPAPGPRPTAPGVPIQPAPPGMMAAGIKRGPPTDPSLDEQNIMRKRIDTGERRSSNPPLASTASPPYVRSPSVMSNGTGVSVAGPSVGGMGVNNIMGSGVSLSDMGMHQQAQSSMGMGMRPGSGMGNNGMTGTQMGQAQSPRSDSNVMDTSILRNSADPATTQKGPSSLQGAHLHGQQAVPNAQLGLGPQGFPGVPSSVNMLDVQAQTQAAQMAQRVRMLQAQAMQSRSNSNAMMPPGVAGPMKDPRMAAMMPNPGVGVSGPGIANNPSSMAMSQGQSHLPSNSIAPMNTVPTVTNPMNPAAGMSMQIQPPPPPNASMVQAIVNAFGPSGLSNYQALQTGSSNPFVSYMLTHVPGFAHLPWQQQLQRMQVVQNNIRQQQQQHRLASGGNNIPQSGQADQVNLRNGVMNAMPSSGGTAHANQGHPQTPIDPTAGSPFNRQSGSPPNVGGMQAMSGSRGPQMTPGQIHGGPGMGLPMRPGTAGSQGGSNGGGSMNMTAMGSPGGAPPGSGVPMGPNAALNQNMTPQERQLRLMQQQMHQRGNDGVMTAQQAYTAADKVRQQHQPGVGMGPGPGQHQVGHGQIGMHPGGTVQSSTARSPPNTASGPAAPFGHVPPMGGTAMGMNMGMNMTGMGIGPMGGMANPNRSAPSPSDMLSAAAAARGLAPNIAQKRPATNVAAVQNDMYHQMALYNQAQQRQQQQTQQHQQQMATGFRPSTAMGGMNPAAMAAAAAAVQQQQQQYVNAGAGGGGTINPGMIYSGNTGGSAGTSLGRVQPSHPQQQQVYLSQPQATGQMSQSQPPYHAISPAALQHHPDAMTRIGTPGSVGGGGGMGGTPRPGSSASNPTSMLPTDGLGGDTFDSLLNWNGE